MSADVNIVLRVNGADANAKIRGVKDGVAATGDAARVATGRMNGMGDAIKRAFSASARGTLNDIRGIAGAASGLVGTLAAIGGGAGLGELVTDSIRARDQMTRLGIESGRTGSRMAATMGEARRVAEEFGTPVTSITAGLQTWQDRFNRLGTGVDAMRDLAEFSRASGEEMTNVVGVAGELERQLGINSTEMGRSLALMRAQGQQGSITFGDIARHAPTLMALEGATFGQRGEGGLREVGAIFQRIATRQPDAAMAATQQHALFESMGDVRTQREMRSHHIAFKDPAGHMLAPLQIIQNVLARTGGDMSKIGEIFHRSEAKDAFLAFIEDFSKGGGDIRAANTDLTALVNVQVEAGQTSRDAASAMQTFEARMQRVRARLAGLVDDRLMSNVERLTNALPGAVDAFTTMVDFVLNRPVTTAALAIGGRVGMGMAGAGLASLGSSMAAAFAPRIAGPIGSAVQAAVAGAGAQHVFVTNWPAGGAPGAPGTPATPGGAPEIPGIPLARMNLSAAFAASPLTVASMVITAAAVGMTVGQIIDENITAPADTRENSSAGFQDQLETDRLDWITRRANQERRARTATAGGAETNRDGWHEHQLIGSQPPITPEQAAAATADLQRRRAAAQPGLRRMQDRVVALTATQRDLATRPGADGRPQSLPPEMARQLAGLTAAIDRLAGQGIVLTDSTRSGVNATTQGRRHGRHAATPSGSVFRQMGPRR